MTACTDFTTIVDPSPPLISRHYKYMVPFATESKGSGIIVKNRWQRLPHLHFKITYFPTLNRQKLKFYASHTLQQINRSIASTQF